MIVNRVGALCVLVSLLAAFLVAWLVDVFWPNNTAGVMVVYAVFLLLTVGIDLVYRWKRFRERGRVRYVHPLTGGAVLFIPVWVCFGLALICGAALWLSAPRPNPTPPKFTQPTYSLEPIWSVVYSATRA
jgi:hypothetical protein